MYTNFGNSLLYFDALSAIMIALVAYISLVVTNFAKRYLEGNQRYFSFFLILGGLVSSISIMVCSDNLLLLLVTWATSNALLVKLMIFNPNWKAAKASGILATKNFSIGFIFISIGFLILYLHTDLSSLQSIIRSDHNNSLIMTTALGFIALGAMTQSAIWPFHKWLLSSLNSPTPVSAIMHAGLINGGGFLLARFSTLYLDNTPLLNLLFSIGIVTALIGTLFKLMQSDVKRMLACSTMGQMGFMIAQCGLGLFPAAISHLCWHGLFKAYLFLASGSIAQEKRLDLHYPPTLLSVVICIFCGILGSYIFCMASGKIWLAQDTTLVLLTVAFISSADLSLQILRQNPIARLPIALTAIPILAAIYGLSMHFIEYILKPLDLMHPQPLNMVYIIGIIGLFLVWILFIFGRNAKPSGFLKKIFAYLYVKTINASQPHPETITTHRNDYKYL